MTLPAPEIPDSDTATELEMQLEGVMNGSLPQTEFLRNFLRTRQSKSKIETNFISSRLLKRGLMYVGAYDGGHIIYVVWQPRF